MQELEWYNDLSKTFMERGYLQEGETIHDRIECIANFVGDTFNDDEIRWKVKDYIEKGYYVLPSPVWSNVGTGRGSGISCFNTHFGDSVESIIEGIAEIAMQCKIGGGTSGYYDMRGEGESISTGGESMGSLHFMEWSAKTKETISQGSTRRGEHAVFLDSYHKDIRKFLNINGEGSKLQRLPFGVCISDEFMENLKARQPYEMEIQAMILDSRNRTGFPYIFFTGNVNRGTSQVYKDKGCIIKSTNMCTEALLPSTEEESFVCDIMGMNLVKRDEWLHTDAIRIGMYMADAFLTEFIDKYKNNQFLKRSVRFAERHRAIGFGGSGYHSLLQSKMIPFESWEAKQLNIEIWKNIREECVKASEEMAIRFGKPDMLKEDKYTMRHTCTNFIAPNTSSSSIVALKVGDYYGLQSQSIEPYTSNYYIKKTAKLKYSVKNPYLQALLEDKNQNTSEVWESILKKNGSVQHLHFLTEHEKLVFRTFIEISQMEIIIQASSRQKYIDQGQSLNLMIHPSTPTRDVNALIIKAYDLGIKTLYYQLGQNASAEFTRDILLCESCSG